MQRMLRRRRVLDGDKDGGRKVSSEGDGSKGSVNELGVSIGELGDLLRGSSAVLVFVEVVLGSAVRDLGTEGRNRGNGRECGDTKARDRGEAEIEVVHDGENKAKLPPSRSLMMKKTG